MATRAVDETGLGRVEDKLIKNRVAITKTPGPEFLEPIARSGDDGLMITERAPFGVICSITPCTNPTETIINNGLGMVAGGNAVLFNVHPLAKQTSAWYIDLLNINLENHDLTEANRRIRLLAEAFRKDGTRITENLDFGGGSKAT